MKASDYKTQIEERGSQAGSMTQRARGPYILSTWSCNGMGAQSTFASKKRTTYYGKNMRACHEQHFNELWISQLDCVYGNILTRLRVWLLTLGVPI